MKAHLLDPQRDFDFAADLPWGAEELMADLQVDTLLEAMAAGEKLLRDVCCRVLLAGVQDPQVIRYRQQVLADCLAHPQVVRQLYDLAGEALQDKRGLWGYASRYPSSILSGAVSQLEAFVTRLRQLRRIVDEQAGMFRSAGMNTLFETLQRELDEPYFQSVSRHLKQLRFPAGELLSAQLGRDNSAIGYVLRAPLTGRGDWRQRLGMAPRTSYSFTLPPRDEAGFEALAEITSRGINLVADATARSADHIASYFRMLRAELGFYVGCLNLHEQLAALGAPTTFPDPVRSDRPALAARALYDPGLALRSRVRPVGNDLEADGRPLVIITGANSGGKSTFLRSLGLAQLMMQCGSFVAAEAYRSGVGPAVVTHFIRAEDASMTSGRLDEELARMSAIADRITDGSLLLFNESFAGTNEREGSEIGRQVVRALLEAGVRVCFVTHQFDFADSFRRTRADSTVFLRAERAPDGARSFRLVPAPPLRTSFGEDVYRRVGGWLDEDH